MWDSFNFSGVLPNDKKYQNILLIDEADAFLDEKYLGESFYPSISIRKATAKSLLDFVWSQRERASELKPE